MAECFLPPAAAAGVQRYFRETALSFGISSPLVRLLAREIRESRRSKRMIVEVIALCDRLFRRPELEAKSGDALVLLRRTRAGV